MSAHDDQFTVQGIVTPAVWDDGDRVIGVAIAAIDGCTYLVLPEGKGHDLIAYTRQGVRARARMITLDTPAAGHPAAQPPLCVEVLDVAILGPVVDWDEEST